MSRWCRIGLTVAFAGMAALPARGIAAEAAVHTKPAQVDAIAGSSLKRVTLTAKAAQRLDVQTAEVRQDSTGRSIVPYAALLYDTVGATWVYVSPQPLTFMRHAVKIDAIRGDSVYLTEGPAVGTKVLTMGVPQVFGAEAGVGH